MLPVDAGKEPETLRRHALKIGEGLRSEAVATRETAARSIMLTLDSTFNHSCEDGARHLEVRVGNFETEAGGRQFFSAIGKADSHILVLIRRGLNAVGRTEEMVLTAFTDGCSGLRRILTDACVTRGADTRPVPHRHVATAPEANSRWPVGRSSNADSGERGDRRGGRTTTLAAMERQSQGRSNQHRSYPRGDASFSGRTRQRKSIASPRKLWTALHVLDGYLTGRSDCSVNYAERHRTGLRVGTAITEGTVNFLPNRRTNKSQQKRRSRRGADLLLQVRCAVYNGTLGSGFGQKFYPANDRHPQVVIAA
jgi:hypothetical protein